MLKKRIINIRVMFAIFCGLMVGILFPYVMIQNICNVTTLLVVGILIVLCVIGLYIYAELTHKHNVNIKFRENVSPLLKYASIGFFVAFVVGVFLICQPIISVYSLTDYGESEVMVTGVVSDYIQDESTYNKFIVSDCVIDTGVKTQVIDYKICVYTSNFVNVELGEIITFKSVLDRYQILKSSDFSKLIQKIGYKTFLDGYQISIAQGSPSLKDIVKDKTHDVLNKNLNEDNAGISYAILFGEKQGLSDNLTDMFSYAGISHILAVSGLHIGVLVSSIYFFLKKIRVNGFVRIMVLGLIVLFYSYLCSFTPSVCRASIMAMITALCDVCRLKSDGISSLSIAGIIILLFDPLSLFSISFQLSFLCVFSIIALAPTITRCLMKIKFPKFLADSLAVSVATNLVILPVCMNVFTKVSLLGIITNVFVLPIFSGAYVLLFMVVVLSFIWSQLGVLLSLPNLLLHLIKTIANFVASIDMGVFKVFSIAYWALFLVVITSLVIHFLMVNARLKGLITAILIVITVSIFVSSTITNQYIGNNLIFGLKYKSNVCYYVKDNDVTLIGSNVDRSLIISEMKKLKLKNINTIIAYDLQLNDIDSLISLCEEFDVQNIYLPDEYEYKAIAKKFKNPKYFASNILINDMKFNSITYKNQVIGVTLKIDSLGTILIPEIKPTKAESKYLLENYANVDFIYVNSDKINLDLNSINAKIVISNESSTLEHINLEKKESYILNEKILGDAL